MAQFAHIANMDTWRDGAILPHSSIRRRNAAPLAVHVLDFLMCCEYVAGYCFKSALAYKLHG